MRLKDEINVVDPMRGLGGGFAWETRDPDAMRVG